MNAELDVQALKTFPLEEVIFLTMLRDLMSLGNKDRDAALAHVETFAPEVRRLFWLALLADGAYPDGVELSYFLTEKLGDFAPQVRMALEEADFKPEAQILAEAMALFGGSYPIESEIRRSFFFSSAAQLRKMRELSKTLPSVSWRRIADYVRRTSALAGWAENARANIPDRNRIRWLGYALAGAAPEDKRQLAAWPKPYRLMYLLSKFNNETANGGVHQFFYNSSGDLAPEVVEALKEVKLLKHAEAIQEGIDSFGPAYPIDTQKRRENHFHGKDWSGWDDRLSALTGRVDDGEIYNAMLRLAKEEGILPI
jgi:hypothetical protein